MERMHMLTCTGEISSPKCAGTYEWMQVLKTYVRKRVDELMGGCACLIIGMFQAMWMDGWGVCTEKGNVSNEKHVSKRCMDRRVHLKRRCYRACGWMDGRKPMHHKKSFLERFASCGRMDGCAWQQERKMISPRACRQMDGQMHLAPQREMSQSMWDDG